MTTVKARALPYTHLAYPGRFRSPSSTYFCARCGIEKSSSRSKALRPDQQRSGDLCVDCLMVDPGFGATA